ncbi:BTAD domain-containing putative transcriptional regulator [Streptomyces sp. NPDC000594]|uniref:AfsR/SARP family transcriptional regulator n=1 Tax=Streptomyces sp. NPDC000594 TaxID=3154261 RepID=UPI003329A3DD
MEILLLGPVGLVCDGGGEGSGSAGGRLELGSGKERAVLAALALESGRPVSLDTLIARVWDDDPPRSARGSLHSYVSRLRGDLTLAAGASGAAPAIVHRAGTYRLEIDPARVDWHRFRRLVETSEAQGDDARTVELLTDAELLWRGEALAGLPGVWAETERRTLSERRITATTARLAARLRLGHFADAVGELSALAGRRPEDEALLGQLMLAYYGCGRYTEALLVHQRARQWLRSEFGAVPGPELNRLHRGILDRIPPQVLARGGDRAPGATPSAPGRSPARRPPMNLPHQPRLVGRRTEVRRLLGVALEQPGGGAGAGTVITLETVTGMPGVGKTNLAVHIAGRLAEEYPDGQLYLDLRAHSPTQEPLTPGAALATLLRLIGVATELIPVGLEERSALWRTILAERRAVVVLDDAAGADQVRPLLAGGSSALMVITSRRHLSGLPHALSIPLDTLPADDAVALFRSFAGTERTEDIARTAWIVGLCGYLPLAIELVANRFRARTSWTLETLGARLTRSPGRLAEIRDADGSLSRAFDLSYRTLTGPQRMAFRRLALHPGADLTVEAAAALLGLPRADTEYLLEELCVCHLLQEPEPERYRAHDLVAEYARALGESEDPPELRARALRRLIDFWLHTAARADRLAYPHRTRITLPDDLSPPSIGWSGPEAAQSWFMAERGNLLAIIHHAWNSGERESAARLAFVVAGFLEAQNHWLDLESLLEQAVDHWTGTGDQPALCRALFTLSTAQLHVSRYAEAAAHGERALDVARATGDDEAEGEALRTLGELHCATGDYRTAVVLLQKNFAITAVRGSVWHRARAHNNLAIALLKLGEVERALEHFQKALSKSHESGDRVFVGKALNNIGDARLQSREIDAAYDSYRAAADIFEAIGYRWGLAISQSNLAALLVESNDPGAALSFCGTALPEFRSLGDRVGVMETCSLTGRAHHALGESHRAVPLLREAAEIAAEIGDTPEEIGALLGLAGAEQALGQAGAAVRTLETALASALRAGLTDAETRVREALSAVAPRRAARPTEGPDGLRSRTADDG